MTLLERLSVASHEMTLAERFYASVQVAIMGIGIVFAALFMLFLIIKMLEKVVAQSDAGAQKAKTQEAAKPEPAAAEIQEAQETEESAKESAKDQEQLVAVITAAVAASLHTSTHSIVVRNIVRTSDTAPAWNRLGRIQQINRQLH